MRWTKTRFLFVSIPLHIDAAYDASNLLLCILYLKIHLKLHTFI